MVLALDDDRRSLSKTARRIATEAVLVTPEMARQWLEGNTHNRPIRDSVVHRYAEDMKAGRWGLTHQGVAFDAEDTMVDGQHRCWAVIEANLPIWMMVSRNVPIEAQAYIDEGVPRSAVDVLRLADPDATVTNYRMSVARRMLIGARTGVQTSRSELLAFYQKHQKAVTFAVDEVFSGKRVGRITPASVGAVIGRASYHEEKDRLRAFGQVMLSGMPASPDDTCAILLRNWLLQGGADRGQRISREALIYGKTQRALQGFLTGEQLRSIYYQRDEIWHLPGEVRRLRAGQRTDGPRRR